MVAGGKCTITDQSKTRSFLVTIKVWCDPQRRKRQSNPDSGQSFHDGSPGFVERPELNPRDAMTARPRSTEKPGGGAIRTAGRLGKPIRALEYAEYDGADKGKRDIRGHNAQPGDERTKGHFQTSQVPNLPIHVAACLNQQS